MPSFIQREIETHLKKATSQFSVIVLTGARQSGKSTLVKKLFHKKFKYVLLDELDTLHFAKEDPRGFLKQYSPPVILDEIQECPELLSYIKRIVDETGQKPGQYVITGSQQFNLMEGVQESLGGRAAILDLSTFSLKELKNLYKSEKHWSFWVSKGSYPKLWTSRTIDRKTWYSSYIRTVIDRDVKQHIQSNYLGHYERFIYLLFSRCAQAINYSDISKDLGVDQKTIMTWFKFLERAQIIFLVNMYPKSLGKRIIKKPKLYFYDSGIVAYSLGYLMQDQIRKGPMAGAIFENLVISEVVKRNFATGGHKNFFFYKESNGVEVDLLIEHGNKLDIIEIKSNETPTMNHARNLERFSSFLTEANIVNQKKVNLFLLSPRVESFKIKNINFNYFKDFVVRD